MHTVVKAMVTTNTLMLAASLFYLSNIGIQLQFKHLGEAFRYTIQEFDDSDSQLNTLKATRKMIRVNAEFQKQCSELKALDKFWKVVTFSVMVTGVLLSCVLAFFMIISEGSILFNAMRFFALIYCLGAMCIMLLSGASVRRQAHKCYVPVNSLAMRYEQNQHLSMDIRRNYRFKVANMVKRFSKSICYTCLDTFEVDSDSFFTMLGGTILNFLMLVEVVTQIENH